MTWTVDTIAEELLAAADAPRSLQAPWSIDVATGYAAQDAGLARRLARGERLIGVKLGVTSRAKQRQVGVDRPSTAWLTDAMVLPADVAVPRSRLVQPRAEPEIAFVLGSRLEGPGVTAAAALAAVSHVVGAIEVIDSRFSGYQFTMADAIADNNSSGVYVTGPVVRPPSEVDLSLEACLLEVDGEVVDSATGAAVWGNPAEALAFAANTVAERGHALEPGWVVLTGGMADAVPVRAGARIAAHFTSLGTITIAGGDDADH
ncbi:2-keto-4-pentenoate hydratase [Pseudonocardia sp. McavD-2-B]|uniref:2-keto-4-pentenoate hydratase n=1 Tax=Pseudonocardia sp. McavD-2-B TaxID=2954499 RepID=UPI00209725B2|nr:fumarylacetoacetate hydrolase family protein [Pseudonocardia sp. McavD-2-B]MCO7191970.1 fumarylacetoacetate hydrolase family protein [Pseudonocardia sp. McavD-2-B]